MVRNMGILVVALALLMVVACGTANPGGAAGSGSIPPSRFAVSAREAAHHMGHEATVCGTVVDSRYVSGSTGSPTFLNFDVAYPNHIFTVVIWGSDRGNFPSNPEMYYRDKEVCASGFIEAYQGKPQIEATSDSQLVINR